MKATGKLLAAALIAAGMSAVPAVAQAAEGGARAPRGDVGTMHSRHGGGRWHGHGHGHGHRHWHGHGHWSWGFYVGAPLLWGAWGWPYYDPWWDGPRVVYREVERMPAPSAQGELSPPPTTEAPRTEGAPEKGPLYMNYCESAKAFYPKVTACPEGWKFLSPSS